MWLCVVICLTIWVSVLFIEYLLFRVNNFAFFDTVFFHLTVVVFVVVAVFSSFSASLVHMWTQFNSKNLAFSLFYFSCSFRSCSFFLVCECGVFYVHSKLVGWLAGLVSLFVVLILHSVYFSFVFCRFSFIFNFFYFAFVIRCVFGVRACMLVCLFVECEWISRDDSRWPMRLIFTWMESAPNATAYLWNDGNCCGICLRGVSQ